MAKFVLTITAPNAKLSREQIEACAVSYVPKHDVQIYDSVTVNIDIKGAEVFPWEKDDVDMPEWALGGLNDIEDGPAQGWDELAEAPQEDIAFEDVGGENATVLDDFADEPGPEEVFNDIVQDTVKQIVENQTE